MRSAGARRPAAVARRATGLSAGTRRRRPLRTLTAAGLALDAAVVLVDVLTPHFDVPIAPLVISPLLPAAAGLLEATTTLAVLAFLLSAVLIAAHGDAGDVDELIRLATVAVIGVLTIVGTRLRRKVDALAQALDALPDAVTIQAAGGSVIYGNRAAAGLTGDSEGLSPQSAAAYLERMVVTDEAGAPLEAERMPAQRLIAGEDAEPVVVRSLDPATGAVAWTRVQASPLRDAEGRVRTAVNVIEDITTVKRAEQRSSFLADAGALLGSSLDTALTLQRTAQLVVPELADWCSVDLLTPDGRCELAALAHIDSDKVALGHELRRRYPPDLTEDVGIGGVLRTGEPQLYADLTPELLAAGAVDAGHLALLEEIGFSSVLIVPLAIGSRVIGALTWVAAESRRRYGPEDVTTATELAARAAVAVENARVHSARVKIASVLQKALLPRELPHAPGWELAAHFRAAGAANEVGGDFYDVVVLDDGSVLALVGDVAGKGAPAAALTARTRHTLVTAAELGGGDARAGLDLVNATLQAEDDLELCSVVVLLARGSELTVVSAGHPLPLLLRDGALSAVGVTSPMLGAAPIGHAWAAGTVELLPGDLIVLHTDGVTDAVGRAERFGEERLLATLRDGPAQPQAAIDGLVARLDAFEVGPQADDRALLALRRTR